MSPLLTQLFGFMLGTFVLGLILGWLIWCFKSATKKELVTITAERDFWENYVDQIRNEVAQDRAELDDLREESAALRKAVATFKS